MTMAHYILCIMLLLGRIARLSHRYYKALTVRHTGNARCEYRAATTELHVY